MHTPLLTTGWLKAALRRSWLPILAGLALSAPATAQSITATSYPLTATTGAVLEDMTTAQTAIGTGIDDTPTGVIPFGDGFTFVFAGEAHSTFSTTPDGFLRLGGQAAAQFTNDLASATNYPILAPYWDDQATGTNGSVKYKLVGTAPTRRFVVQWNTVVPRSTTGAATATYQAWLNEGTGVVEFVYGAVPVLPTTAGGYSVGLGANTAATPRYASVTIDPATFTASTVAYGTSNNANRAAFTSGSRLAFTPPATVPAPPTTLTFSNVGFTNFTVNFVDNSTTELGFAVLVSSTANPDLLVRANVASTTTAGTGQAYSATVSGLTVSTTYTVQVVSLTEGRASAPLAGSQATLTPPTLSGAYTIDNTRPTGGTNFISFTDAINTLSVAPRTSAVTFNVSTGQTFNENPPVITASATLAQPVVFQRASATGANPRITPTGGTGSADAGIVLQGADFVTFDGIDIDASAGSAVEFGYVVRIASPTDGASNNVIRNAAITLNRANTSSIALVQSGSASAGGVPTSASAATGTNQNNTYNNLTIRNSYHGVWLYGATVGFADQGTLVFNLTIGSDPAGAAQGDIGGGGTSTVYGIRAFNQTRLTIRDNVIRNLAAATTVYGVTVDAYSGSGADTGNLYNNRISAVRNISTTSTSTAYGINVGLSGSAAITLNVYNNFVSDITSAYTGAATATRVVRGIYVNTGGTVAATLNVAFNSVRVDSGSLTGSSAAYEIATVTGPVISTRNNIFANFTGAQTTAKHYAFITTSATGLVGNTGSVSNNNDLYVANTGNGFVGATGAPSTTATTNDKATLALWQAATTQDAASVSVDPLFAAATDLHLQGTSTLNNAGAPLTGLTTDIDGETRNATTPDIGADEFTPLATDLSAAALLSPGSGTTCYSATEAVTVQIRNNGTTTLDFATAAATITVVVTPPSGMAQTLTTTLNTGTLAPGATQNVTLGNTASLTALGSYSFAVTATVAGDQNTGNDLLSPTPTRVVNAPVAGTLSAASSLFCVSGSTALTLAGAANGSIQLQQSTDNVTFTDVTGATGATFTTPTLSQTTYYRARVICNANTTTSNVLTITVNNPVLTSAPSPLTVCNGTAATLTATTASGTSVRFFSAATGGTALTSTTAGGTTTATTPALTANETFYAEAYTGGAEVAGRAAPAAGAGFLSIDTGLIFTATAGFVIQSAVIYPTGTGTITFALRSSTGTEIAATPAINVTGTGLATPVTVPLNLTVPGAGTNYQLVVKAFTGITDLVRENPLPAGSSFPITSPSGVMSITTGINVTPTAAYYYLYSIAINAECVAATRTAIQVNVIAQPAAPTLTATTQPNGTVVLTSSVATGNQFYFNGQPIPGATGQTYTVTSAALNGSYTVATGTGSCFSAPSAAVAVTVVLGSRTALAGSSLSVYPNPTPNGHFALELRGYSKQAELTVLNVLGQVVRTMSIAPGSQSLHTVAVDLSALPSGMYTLQVASQGGVDTRRVVRQ